MRPYTYLIAILFTTAALLHPIQSHADCFDPESFHDSMRKRDFEAVQEFVNSKRTIIQEEKKKNLKISGDIRFNYYNRTETQDGHHLRGTKATDAAGNPLPFAVPRTEWETELNLQFDYKCGRGYGQVKLQHDNPCGIQSLRDDCFKNSQLMYGTGFCDDLCLKRCWLGYRIVDCPDRYTLDVEIGRRPLNSVFESYIQFKNRFDGIMFRFNRQIEPSSKFYVWGGPFLVDERVNHFAFIVETGYLNFMNKRIDVRYSFIDWLLHGRNRCDFQNPLGARFRNSQFTLDINLPEVYKKKSQIYGAWLINTAATRNIFSEQTKSNIAWYAGYIMGEVKKKGDWAIDISYEYCGAQAVPDSDVSGIDRGNIAKDFFYQINPMNKRGKANYKGWEFQLLYAITDRLSTNIIYDTSTAANKNIGGLHGFTKLEVDVILAF